MHLGPSDGTALVGLLAGQGRRRVLHLCGREHLELAHPAVKIRRAIVYAAEAADQLPPPALDALADGAVALLHSPRASRLFAQLVDEAGLERSGIRAAAISEAAAEAAGRGWAEIAAADAPRDQPMLELAAKLCNYGSASGTGKHE